MKHHLLSSFIITLLFCLNINSTSAQSPIVCGTDHDHAFMSRLETNKKFFDTNGFQQRGVTKYIPITFILVADDNGNGRIGEEKVFDQLCNLNAFYADQEIVFYLDELRYLDKTVSFETPSSAAGQIHMNINKDNNAINIFITKFADSGSGTEGTVLAYYSQQRDWIVSRKDQINIGSSTLAHEMGHFFSVAHPHLGWECVPYNIADYGNPVNVNSTLPCPSGAGAGLIELVDGSNCANTADRLCDTPADYNFGLGFSSNCNPVTSVKDKNGDTVSPLYKNVMGYYPSCDSYNFTQSQKNLINSDYFSIQRAYIRTGFAPNAAIVSEGVVYIYPEDGGGTQEFDNVTLDWEDTPNADTYLIMIDRLASFGFNPQRYVVDASELNLIDLEEDKKYYWRVFPLNAASTCAGWSATRSFTATTSTGFIEIPGVKGLELFPNPIAGGQNLFLRLETIEAFNANVQLLDFTGRSIKNWGTIEFNPGSTNLNKLIIEDATPGIYLVSLTSERGTMTRKVSVH